LLLSSLCVHVFGSLFFLHLSSGFPSLLFIPHSQLIGKVGRVVSSQTLGGWHEVSLEAGGGVVRVQRNALEVLALAPAVPGVPVHGHPTSTGRSGGGSHRAAARSSAAGGAAASATAPDNGSARHGHGSAPSRGNASGLVSSPADGGGSTSRAGDGKRKRPASAASLRDRSASGSRLRVGGAGPGAGTVANFDALQFDSLNRYRTVYGLNVAVDCSRDELVRAVRRHFASSSVDELQVISDFLRRVRHCSSPAL